MSTFEEMKKEVKKHDEFIKSICDISGWKSQFTSLIIKRFHKERDLWVDVTLKNGMASFRNYSFNHEFKFSMKSNQKPETLVRKIKNKINESYPSIAKEIDKHNKEVEDSNKQYKEFLEIRDECGLTEDEQQESIYFKQENNTLVKLNFGRNYKFDIQINNIDKEQAVNIIKTLKGE